MTKKISLIELVYFEKGYKLRFFTKLLKNVLIWDSRENLSKLDQSSSSTSRKKASAFQWGLLVYFFVDSFFKRK